MNDTSATARSTRLGNLGRGEGPRVHLFPDDDPRIRAQARVELAVADVHGVHPRGAPLQKAIGESPGRGADVEADEARGIDAEVVEGGGELDASARDVGMGRTGHGDLRRLVDARTRLGSRAPVHRDEAGEDQGLRLLPRRREPAIDEEQVEASLRLQRAITTFIDPSGSRARSNAATASAIPKRCETRSATATRRLAIADRASRVSSGPQE